MRRQSRQSSQRSQSTQSLRNEQAAINECVRFIILHAGENKPIRPTTLKTEILNKYTIRIQDILGKINDVLSKVYQYKLVNHQNKYYLVVNILPDNKPELKPEDLQEVPEDVNKVLIFLVLTHIFMSENDVTEECLISFLEEFHIDFEQTHELYGNVKQFITHTMVDQKYLSKQTDSSSSVVYYKWGARAEIEISKKELLEFVAMIHDNKPRQWTAQRAKIRDQEEEYGQNPGASTSTTA